MATEARTGTGGAARADQRTVRRSNLGVVLRHVAEHGPRSRATIAAETGFNKTTVSSLVSALIELGLLTESGAEGPPRTVGRPGRVVALHGEGVVALGLEVNVDYLSVLVVDLLGRVRGHEVEEQDNRGAAPQDVLARLARLARRSLDEARAEGLRPVGAGVALPGLVDVGAGVLLLAPNLGWARTPVAELLAEALGRPGLPIDVDNEANLAALAELDADGGARRRHLVVVSGEIGVGAGLVVDGELFRGAAGFGGELGHVTVDPDGAPCACGSRGCLETIVGQEALLRRAGLTVPAGAASHSLTRTLVERARDGDATTLAALADAGRTLGVALASLANVVNPQAIVLGGAFAAVGPWLEGPVRAELRRRVLASRWADVDVVVSRLGDEAAARGAAALVLRKVLADPAAFTPSGATT